MSTSMTGYLREHRLADFVGALIERKATVEALKVMWVRLATLHEELDEDAYTVAIHEAFEDLPLGWRNKHPRQFRGN